MEVLFPSAVADGRPDRIEDGRPARNGVWPATGTKKGQACACRRVQGADFSVREVRIGLSVRIGEFDGRRVVQPELAQELMLDGRQFLVCLEERVLDVVGLHLL